MWNDFLYILDRSCFVLAILMQSIFSQVRFKKSLWCLSTTGLISSP